MHEIDDQDVISAVLEGDTEAYGMLVQKYQKPIYNAAYRMTGSRQDALDICQDTFLKAFEELHRFQAGRRFFPWIYTMVMNRSKNHLRRNKQWKTEPVEDHEGDVECHEPHRQEEALCRRLDSQRLMRAMDELSVDQREALILRYQDDRSMEDISQALGLSLSGAKMRVARGLARLREIIGNRAP
jgi:RNA polymerase sigma-70 factor (ECF subfamily)